ncbi:MAG: cell division protein FtsH [Candidatus Buchananbacteria bacterium RIFCSPHIGHO2_01_FULL_39_14]|uniref:ATP-dependent zinc metalloprotease FtsH n=2 Tax=Candidatus Buchananiibacteriota TaxID=1817903 RepID=A0A1G1YTL9_9BACT|nr:MAG: cell division protein FtsH [Candidatus Buchananbacteria bacterium RIFCSPHIGHO2_01_FULL_39_14]OGY49404.1 MAG: cell division protein FtsH [Candidatus Buchananbacteria bacterium RIFCSPHIGHO2_02_FULL_39_17]OGY55702.1 MAG: cell division protein FtsH [Candidatus Buchananbacteria bacterium RIFCSPLOWO2_01_FULL_40_23b]
MKNLAKNFLLVFLIFLVIASLFSFSLSLPQVQVTLDITSMVDKINAGKVKSLKVINDKIFVTLANDSQAQVQKEPAESLSELLNNYAVDKEKLKQIKIEVEQDSSLDFWLAALLPFLIPFLLIAGFIYFMMRQVQGANSRALMFGQSRAREVTPQDRQNKVTFKDVAGVKEAKAELVEVVDFLKNPKKFINLGARIPKGVLLVGPPGTGKTLLARAVAGEANVQFFNISGSEFVEMFVGVGASRVRDLFRKAKRSAPCIVFIDELDAVGRQRGAGLGGSNDEREQTLNQILVEMDGFDVNTNVIVMAATNRPDILDIALLRPGRFDRRIILDAPNIEDREGILKVHARKKPLAPDVNLRRIAERTPGFTGADLNNLLNEAAILAARRDKNKVEMAEILESIEKVILGPERKSHILGEREKKITAYHEAGHALVAHKLLHTDPVQKVSIVSRGQVAGYTLKMPIEDKYFQTKSEFIDELAVLLAGYTSEKEIFGDISTGAANDLKEVTRLARRLIMEYGMSDVLGPRTFGKREELIFLGREITEQRDYSEKVAEQIDKEIAKLVDNAVKTAKAVIKEYFSKLEEIANLLLQKETLEREEFEAIFKSSPAPVS